MASIGSHIARTSLVYYVTVMLLSLRGIILIPLLLHTFGPENYGLYVLALSGVSYGVVIAQFGLDSSIYQYLTPVLKANAARTVFWTALQTAAAVACVGVVVAAITGLGFVGGDRGVLITACALVSTGQVLWGLSLTPYRCEERSGIYMGVSMSTTLGDFIITATTALLSRNLAIVFCALACYHLGVAVVMLFLQQRRLPFRLWSAQQFSKLVRFGFDGLINQLVITGYFVWDRTIVSLTAGLTAVAAYAPGMAMGAIVMPLAGTSAFTLPTLLVRPSIRNSPSAKRAVLRQAIRQYSLVAIPAAAGATLISRPFLRVITTPALAEVAAAVSGLACCAVLASGLARFAILALRADGDDVWLSKDLIGHFVVFVALAGGAAFFWPGHASLVVAASILAVNLSQMIAAFVRLRRYVTNVLAVSLFLTPLLGTLAFAILFAFVRVQGMVGILVMVAISVAVYVGVCMALERTTPRALLAMIRKPIDLDEDEALAVWAEPSTKPPVLLYSGPNHLFASAGIFYAAELAEAFDVHVILNKYGWGAITQPMLDALARRGITVHWLPDERGVKKHEFHRDFVDGLLERVPASLVFADDDMGLFNVILARRAKQNGARVVCFQTGTFDRSGAADYQAVLTMQAKLRAQSYRLPMSLAVFLINLENHLRHYWYYILAPLIVGYRPYPGLSSPILRRSHTGRRDGELFLFYEPGAHAIAVSDGTPEDQMVAIGHPLLRKAGHTLFAEIYPPPDFLKANAALLLVDVPADPECGVHKESEAITGLVRSVAAVAEALSRSYPQVLIKPHPVLQNYPEFLVTLEQALAGVKGVHMVAAQVNALGFLSAVRTVVGEQSTVLKLARYFPGLLVVSTGFSERPRRPFHASETGMAVFDSWRDIVALDLSALISTASGSGCPGGVDPAATIVDILNSCGMLKRTAGRDGYSSAWLREGAE